jgi:spermidine synthase
VKINPDPNESLPPMITDSDATWFTEICKESGSAISFEIRAKLHQEQSPFQRIEIYATTQFGNLMVIDGFVMLTTRDNFLYHEMMSHPALFTHPNPKRVVIIGGGDCGTLREVLKHPGVEHALQVDIDDRVTRLGDQYFPELCESNGDPRAELVFGDGIQWMKDAAPGSVDVIIVDSTDPIGPAEGLFTEAFFRDCHRALGEHGVMVQQSESPLLHYQSIIQPLHRAMGAAGFSLAIHPAGGPLLWRESTGSCAVSESRTRSGRNLRPAITTPPYTRARWPRRSFSGLAAGSWPSRTTRQRFAGVCG